MRNLLSFKPPSLWYFVRQPRESNTFIQERSSDTQLRAGVVALWIAKIVSSNRHLSILLSLA